MRILHISDTHLSPTKTHFLRNWEPVAAATAEQRPDLVIHTGDVTVDGADVEADLAHAAALMRGLGVPYRAVPGNHDIGDAGHPRQPVDGARLARWHTHFGADRWIEDVAGCRLIGFNAMLLGFGGTAEAEQEAWLEAATAAAGGRAVAWFLHRPLFLEGPQEGDTGYWSVKPEARARLLALVRRHRVGLVASGHLHKAHRQERDGTVYVWAPATAFLVGERIAPPMPGERRLGAVLYDIADGRIEDRMLDIPGLTPYRIEDVIDEVYPRRPPR